MRGKRCLKCGVIQPVERFYKAGPTQPQTYGGIRMPCKACVAAWVKTYRPTYCSRPGVKELLRERDRAKVKKNPGVYTAIRERFDKNHPNYVRDRYAKDPSGFLLRAAVRRTRKKKTGGTLTKAEWRAVLSIRGRRCFYCGREGVPLQIEHMVPVVRGGCTVVGNVVPACKRCNAKKGTKTAAEFMESVQ